MATRKGKPNSTAAKLIRLARRKQDRQQQEKQAKVREEARKPDEQQEGR